MSGRSERGPILEAVQVEKRFNSFRALRGVSFTLAEGEILGLTGPNGSGKTTLLNIVSGLLKPDRGDVFFTGKRMTGLPMEEFVRAGIVRTFQVPQTFRSFTVRETVRLAALASGGDAKSVDEIVEAVLERTGLFRQGNLEAGKLSQGCLRRLEIARAVALRPRVILLDEIFSALSVADQREVEELMLSLNAEGISFVLVSHNLLVVEELCQRCLVIEDGLVVYEGSPEGVREALR
ncbi:MAG: ATP-binding cassette domain-containing protein [Deltaproteobacteria bacterium]|nr:MAG: ATP-binding cassette domain-containing protein [Deltaproteobacteria bacterium]